MKLFLRRSLFASLGVFLSVCPTMADSQSPVSYNNQNIGSRYQAVRSASRYSRFQEVEEAVEGAVDAAADVAEAAPNNALAPAQNSTPPPNNFVPAAPQTAAPVHAHHGSAPYSQPNYSGNSCSTGDCSSNLAGSYYTGHESCGDFVDTAPCGWFGGVYGLLMTRADNWGTGLNYATGDAFTALQRSNDGFDHAQGGVDFNFGKYFGGGCYGWQVVYSSIFPEDHDSYVYQSDLGGADLLNSLRFDNLVYSATAGILPVDQVYGNATRTAVVHRLRRSYEMHNVEINLVRDPKRRTKCFNYELLAGFRYFRFNDGFIFSTDYANSTFGDSADELDYAIDVDNDLFGFQLGGRMDRYLNDCWSVNLGTKFGIYNNHVNHLQYIGGGNGYAYETVSGSANDYYVESSDDDVAFLGELTVGLSYDYGCHWRFTGGYRVLSACGIATADAQIPRQREFAAINPAIYTDECLVLHGGYFGVEYNW